MIAGLIGFGLGLLLLFLASVVLAGLRANNRHLRDLGWEIDRVVDDRRTPEERAQLLRRLEDIEAQKRTIFGRYENAGG